jgi:hypothetical protein
MEAPMIMDVVSRCKYGFARLHDRKFIVKQWQSSVSDIRLKIFVMRMGVDSLPCSSNNQCLPFDDLHNAVLRPESNGAVVCINACNIGAEKGPSGPPGCTNFLGAAAWFKVKTDSQAEVISITAVSDEFNTPQVLVMRGVNCVNFTPVNCDYGTDGVVSIINFPVDPDTAYYIIVGDRFGLEGAFDLCVSTH